MPFRLPQVAQLIAAMRQAFALLLVLSGAGVAHAATPEQIEQGRILAGIGGCANCHTAKDGKPFAGGDAIETPVGSFFAPNITSDPQSGLGVWSDADFLRAMREGVSPTDDPYYPAFPYTSFTHMTDQDLLAIKAYLDTVPAVAQADRPHDLWFPFNVRWGVGLWQWAFFEPARFTPDQARSAAWNRGAYLVTGPGHCQECHTPRTFYGVLKPDQAFAGGDFGPNAGPNISGDTARGIGEWSAEDLTSVLESGMTPDGDFLGGEMAKVIQNGTAILPAADLAGVVEYLKSLPPR